MSVRDRLAKARAVKATKRLSPLPVVVNRVKLGFQVPSVKPLRGPSQELVHIGERGGSFYMNKNGNRTYLSSNR